MVQLPTDYCPFYSTSNLAMTILFCWTAENRNLREWGFLSLHQTKWKCLFVIKDSVRNPFLAPYCCTHVWNYPQGNRFVCKRTLIGLRCDWLHRLHCQMNWFCKPNRRHRKLNSDYSGGIGLTWVTASGHGEARALAAASLLNNKILGG